MAVTSDEATKEATEELKFAATADISDAATLAFTVSGRRMRTVKEKDEGLLARRRRDDEEDEDQRVDGAATATAGRRSPLDGGAYRRRVVPFVLFVPPEVLFPLSVVFPVQFAPAQPPPAMEVPLPLAVLLPLTVPFPLMVPLLPPLAVPLIAEPLTAALEGVTDGETDTVGDAVAVAAAVPLAAGVLVAAGDEVEFPLLLELLFWASADADGEAEAAASSRFVDAVMMMLSWRRRAARAGEVAFRERHTDERTKSTTTPAGTLEGIPSSEILNSKKAGTTVALVP